MAVPVWTGENPIRDGFTDVAVGKIATVVTHLEMMARPAEQSADDMAADAERDMHIRRLVNPDVATYRQLFRSVGEPWLWFGRLTMTDDELAANIQDEAVEVYALEEKAAGSGSATPGAAVQATDGQAQALGLLELDFRVPGECELAYFGLVPGQIGRGAGRFLMNQAIERAWSQPGLQRFHVHTCTLDSQVALPFYLRSGFQPITQQVEVFDDPRVTGTHPRAAAPHVPVIDS